MFVHHAEAAAVPKALCVEAHHFRELAQRLQLAEDADALDALDALDAKEGQSIAPLSAALRARIQRAGIPDPLRSAILTAIRELGAERVAVRSSATAEDLADASFAGQYDSFLNLQGGSAVLDAVLACWASTFSDRAVASRQRLGIAHRDVAMAVVIQAMVAPEVSGVAFTHHPLEERPVLLVEACTGLGEELVSGRLDPDRFEIDREGQHWRQLSGAAGTNLTESRLFAMRDEFLRLEAQLGFPADLEWSWCGDQLYLLQGRPISTSRPAATRPQPGGDEALQGTAASPGVAEGRARVLLEADQVELDPGDVLVTTFTDPAWTRHFTRASALVMEHGGLLCHGAILARECGIPAVVGVPRATSNIDDRRTIRVDGDAGEVRFP